MTTLLGISPHEIGEKRAFFTLGQGPKFGYKNAFGKSLMKGERHRLSALSL